MKLEAIKSKAIALHGYDSATGTMRVQLHNGRTYEYDDVSLEKYAAFTGADSPGKFWNTKIKGAHNGREVKSDEELDGH